MGFSETQDFKKYIDIGHFNEGIMKTTNFDRPKHGAVIHLTRYELCKVAEYWNVKIDLD